MDKSIVKTKTRDKLLSIQILRGLAAAMVVYVHALANFRDKIDNTYVPVFAFDFGELGVKLFFCISGFIIYTTSKNLTPSFESIKIFFSKRFVRIVPIYWFFTFVYALKLLLQQSPPSVSDLIKSLLFIPYTTDGLLMRPIIGQGWTLNFEMFFYLIFGISLMLNKFWRLIFISFGLIGLMASHILGLLIITDSLFMNGLYFLSDYYLIYFLIGIFFAICWESSIFSIIVSNAMKLIYFLIFILIYVVIHLEFNITSITNQILTSLFCLFSMFIALTSSGRNKEKIRSTSLNERLFSVFGSIGNASYSTYLTHGFVLGFSTKVVVAFGGLNAMSFSMLMILICTIIGFIVFKYIEKPLLNFFNMIIFEK